MRKYTTKQKFRQVSATRSLTVKHDQLEVNENDKKKYCRNAFRHHLHKRYHRIACCRTVIDDRHIYYSTDARPPRRRSAQGKVAHTLSATRCPKWSRPSTIPHDNHTMPVRTRWVIQTYRRSRRRRIAPNKAMQLFYEDPCS